MPTANVRKDLALFIDLFKAIQLPLRRDIIEGKLARNGQGRSANTPCNLGIAEVATPKQAAGRRRRRKAIA